MADDTAHGSPSEAGKQTTQTTQKQTATPATYARSSVVAGGVATMPFGFQSLILTVNELVHAIWVNVPVMSDDRALSLGVLLTALPAFWASFSIRGTEVKE